jgi:sugar phosphate isomerase/epimerase
VTAGDELLALYWTVSGPVEVHTGREWSLFELRDRCAEAARVGFSGIGLWHADLEHVLETRTLDDVKQTLADSGLRYLELEFLMDWFLDPADERRRASDEIRTLLLDAAAALGAHHVKVGNIPGIPATIPQLTERFGELCAEAAERLVDEMLLRIEVGVEPALREAGAGHHVVDRRVEVAAEAEELRRLPEQPLARSPRFVGLRLHRRIYDDQSEYLQGASALPVTVRAEW